MKLRCEGIASIILAGILYTGCLLPAEAQNTTCSDRPAADSSNACANTRFVQQHLTLPSSIVLPNGQIIIGNVSNVGQAQTMSGDIGITNTGVTSIQPGVIVNADVNAAAAIDGTKLAVNASGTGTTSRAISAEILARCISPQMYGAAGNGSTDDTTALNNWYAQVVAQGVPGCLLPGSYRATANLTWDLTSVATTGITIVGPGLHRSEINFDAGFGLTVTSSSAADLFYLKLIDFSINGNISGPVLRIGDDALTKSINEGLVRLRVANTSSNAAAEAVRLNSVLNVDFNLIANNSGSGVGNAALVLRQARFNRFFGSMGNAAVGVKLQDGYNYGNVFTALDLEVLNTCLNISGSSLQNTWIGGTFICTNGYNFTAGSANVILNPNEVMTTPVVSGTGLVYYPTEPVGTGQIYIGNNSARPTASSTPSLGFPGSTLGTISLSGNTSGTVTIRPQAAAGTYNFNLPASAGTSGGPLLSGGGGSNPHTYGTRSGNTTVFGTTSGALTSGNCAKFDASGNIVDNGAVCGGSGSPGGANTQVQFNNSGAFGGSANLTWVSPALTIGVAGSTTGQLKQTGSTSGTVTVTPQATAGTVTMTWPNTSGTVPSTATSPVTLNTTTGALGCATCGVTGSGLNQFASTTSAQLAGVISDETGTGVLVFSTTPVFSTNITTPIVIGGTAAGSSLTLQSTSGVGTTDTVQIKGGNNGATTFGYFNSTGFGIGATPTTTLYVANPSGSGTVTQRMHSGVNDADYAFDGTSIYYTNYVSGGAISFTQVGAGSQSFVVNSATVLSLSSANAAVTGNLAVSGSIACGAPITKTGTSGTVGNSECSVIFNPSGTYTATLPTASSYPGRFLYVKSIAAQLVNSASSNVVPRTTATAGTAILAAGAGNWATLQSDGTNWVIMAGN